MSGYGTLKSISPKRWQKIFWRDNMTCQICGRTPEDNIIMVVDHKLPRARGGSNETHNLWTLCCSCNSAKHVKTVEEFLALRAHRDLEREKGRRLKRKPTQYNQRRGAERVRGLTQEECIEAVAGQGREPTP